MINRNRLKIRRLLKRTLCLIFLVVVLLAIGTGVRNYLIYGRLFPGLAGGSREEEEPDPTPLDEEPDPVSPEEKPDPGISGEEPNPSEETVPVINPLEPENTYLVADGDYLLALVTKQTTLGKYAPRDIVPLPDKVCQTWKYYLREEAADHLLQLWEAAQGDGIDLKVISAYRSYETQSELFHDYASQHGEEAANRFSARPGQSEHQLGTTVDFGGTSNDQYQSFADTPQGQWLAGHAYEFGFVMSYPPGSEEITGYVYEPWHFRYIGMEAAREWKESGQSLSEFLLRYRQQLTLLPQS